MPAKGHDSRVTVVLRPETQEQLDRRAPRVPGGAHRSQAAEEALTRYYGGLERAGRALQQALTPAHLSLLADLLNGTWVEPTVIDCLADELEDGLEDDLAEKWEVDGPAFVEQLRLMSYLDRAALVDAVERWWRIKQGERPASPWILLGPAGAGGK